MFGAATAVRRVGQRAHEAVLDEGWWVVRGPSGGYLAAIILRAILAELGDSSRTPRSLTVHFLSPPAAGPVRVEVEVVRAGSSVTTACARMTQHDRPVAVALGALSTAWPTERDFSHRRMPQAPPPEEAVPAPSEGVPPILLRYDIRLALGELPFQRGEEALTGGWIRTEEPEVVDPCVAAAMTDAWFPAVFVRLDRPAALPTIDLTIHFRESLPLRDAQPGDWSFGVFRSAHARDGLVEEDGELWSRDGVLLAQSRQLAVLV